ncbi:hypothetical protein CGCSCA1_v008220 [Colletotrichum siamense]|nr:hypothetical protein CGCSCA1_v008220 [Colletotrichum siamense]
MFTRTKSFCYIYSPASSFFAIIAQSGPVLTTSRDFPTLTTSPETWRCHPIFQMAARISVFDVGPVVSVVIQFRGQLSEATALMQARNALMIAQFTTKLLLVTRGRLKISVARQMDISMAGVDGFLVLALPACQPVVGEALYPQQPHRFSLDESLDRPFNTIIHESNDKALPELRVQRLDLALICITSQLSCKFMANHQEAALHDTPRCLITDIPYPRRNASHFQLGPIRRAFAPEERIAVCSAVYEGYND